MKKIISILLAAVMVMALLAAWLQSRYGWGTWVMVVAIVVGLLSSGSGAYNFYRKLTVSEEKKKKKPEKRPISFFRHE